MQRPNAGIPAGIGLAELRGVAPQAAIQAPDVSGWSVGMHVEHLCLAMIAVFGALVASEPPVPRQRFNLITAAVFATGRIPRGRGKSPAQAVPRQGVLKDALVPMLDESERWFERARQCSSDQWFRHFAFGIMDRDRTIRFMGIHNRHHLRIIQDILRA